MELANIKKKTKQKQLQKKKKTIKKHGILLIFHLLNIFLFSSHIALMARVFVFNGVSDLVGYLMPKPFL